MRSCLMNNNLMATEYFSSGRPHASIVYRLGHRPFTAGRRGSIPPGSTKSTDEHVQLVRNSQERSAGVRTTVPPATPEGLDENRRGLRSAVMSKSKTRTVYIQCRLILYRRKRSCLV